MKAWLSISGRKTQSNRGRDGSAGERGVSIVWLALMLPVLIGFVGLVIDVGMILEVRRQLQTAVDAGSLAGAQLLPNSPGDAEALARSYVGRNYNETLRSVSTSVGTTYVANDSITVTAVRSVPLVLMPVLGYANAQDVAATATAIVGSLSEAGCVIPLGVTPDEFSLGDTVTLKVGAHGNLKGNFQALDLYGKGGDGFADGVAGRMCAGVSAYQMVDSLPGNKVGPTTVNGFAERIKDDAHSFSQVVDTDAGTLTELGENCPRIVLVPIVDSFDVNGKKPVQVLAFAHFFVESWDREPAKGSEKNDRAVVRGRFFDIVSPGDFMPNNPYGARVVRLIR